MKQGAQAGFTLVEVLVAIALFSVVSTAVLGLFPGLLAQSVRSRAEQAVTAAAKQFMEDGRAAYEDAATFDAGAPGLPAAPDPGQGYRCSRGAAAQLSDGATVLLRRVTLSCAKADQATYTFSLDLGRPDR